MNNISCIMVKCCIYGYADIQNQTYSKYFSSLCRNIYLTAALQSVSHFRPALIKLSNNWKYTKYWNYLYKCIFYL